jgi:hypothetical protein
MKVPNRSVTLNVTGRLGPVCIACGNTRTFWIVCPEGECLAEMPDLPEGDVRVTMCGRCRSRNSVVITRVD